VVQAGVSLCLPGGSIPDLNRTRALIYHRWMAFPPAVSPCLPGLGKQRSCASVGIVLCDGQQVVAAGACPCPHGAVLVRQGCQGLSKKKKDRLPMCVQPGPPGAVLKHCPSGGACKADCCEADAWLHMLLIAHVDRTCCEADAWLHMLLIAQADCTCCAIAYFCAAFAKHPWGVVAMQCARVCRLCLH